ncbi:MAG TPA: glutamate-cysteine ligase family protein [Rhodocyclaceae bacterium]
MTIAPVPLAAFSGYGIELEYMIVDSGSLRVLPIADDLLAVISAHGAAGSDDRFAWSNELVLHLLELKNRRPMPDLEQLAPGFQREVARANELLAPLGARLMPGGMHPWMDPASETRLWPHHDAAIYRAYDRIFDCRGHGWANIQSMQLNLPFADDAEFERLHAAVRLLLPILPALAASSPIADGRVRAEVDFRMESYRHHVERRPSLIGLVIPDNAMSCAGYRRDVLEPMYAEVAPFDPAGDLHAEWLNARGAIPRFDRHAIELRVIDMQECPQADLGIAALAGAAARALYEERWCPLNRQQGMGTGTLAAIFRACVRDADQARIDDARYLALFGFRGASCRAQELWHHLFQSCRNDTLLSPPGQTAIEVILEHGPLARRILRSAGDHPDRDRLAAIYRELCDCLAEGRQFKALP